MSERQPSALRIAGAALAAVAAAAATAMVQTGVTGLIAAASSVGGAMLFVGFFATLYAALHLVIAIPAYVALRRQGAFLWRHALTGGFLIGAIPLGLMTIYPSAQRYQQGQTLLVVDGEYTPAGWLAWLESMGWCGLYGAVGGLAFWWVLRARA